MNKVKRVQNLNRAKLTVTTLTTAIPEEIKSLSTPGDEVPAYYKSTHSVIELTDNETASSPDQFARAHMAESRNYLLLIYDLVRNSGFYAISSLASPLVTLILSPFLARLLSRTDYGALAVLNTAVLLITGITALGLSPAFIRMFAYDCKTRRQQLDSLSTFVLLSLLVLVPIAAIGIIAAPWLSLLVLGSTRYSGAIQVAALLVLTQNLTNPSLAWLRVENRAGLFSALSVGNLLMTAAATVVLVGSLHMGIVGSLIANGLGDVLIITCTLPVIFFRAGFCLRFAMAGSMLTFGIPHVINLISGWILQLSDRYLLGHIASLTIAAGYSVAYSLGGFTSSAIVSPFLMAWWVIIYPIAKREDAQLVFQLIFRWFSFVLLFVTLGLSLFGGSILDLVFPASYHTRLPIVPIIALSTMFSGIFNIVSLGASLKRRTWLVSFYFIVSALINIGLNILLIPTYSAMGAAIATLLAYIVLASMAYFINQRIYYVPFEVNLFLVTLGIGIVFYMVDNNLTQGQKVITAWSMHSGTLLLFGLSLFLLEWFQRTTRKNNKGILNKENEMSSVTRVKGASIGYQSGISPIYTNKFFRERQEQAWNAASLIVPKVLETVQPSSVIDVGCGTGEFLAVFQEHGVEDILGIDGDYVQRDLLVIPQENFRSFDLSHPFTLDRTYDLALCLEVAEHLPLQSASDFITSLSHLASIVLFSAAVPYQGGNGHLNEQWPEYWADLFKRHGFVPLDTLRRSIWHNQKIPVWYRQNMLFFCKEQAVFANKKLSKAYDMTNYEALSIVHPEMYLQCNTKNLRMLRRLSTYWLPLWRIKEKVKNGIREHKNGIRRRI